MEARIINLFIDATLHVLGTLAGAQFEVQKPQLKADSAASGAVAGVILLSGALTGSVALRFDRACVLQVVSSMLGEEMQAINQDITDAVGEITNMVSGQTSQKLADLTAGIAIRPGEVVMGKGGIPGQKPGAPVIVVPLVGPTGSLNLEACWQE